MTNSLKIIKTFLFWYCSPSLSHKSFEKRRIFKRNGVSHKLNGKKFGKFLTLIETETVLKGDTPLHHLDACLYSESYLHTR